MGTEAMRRTIPHIPAELHFYLKRLNSYHKQRRVEALAAARQLSSDQLLSLATVATQPIVGTIRRSHLFNPIIWIELLLPAVWKILLLLHQPMPFVGWAAGVMTFVMMTPIVMMFYGMAADPTRLYMALRELIAEREDACLLG